MPLRSRGAIVAASASLLAVLAASDVGAQQGSAVTRIEPAPQATERTTPRRSQRRASPEAAPDEATGTDSASVEERLPASAGPEGTLETAMGGVPQALVLRGSFESAPPPAPQSDALQGGQQPAGADGREGEVGRGLEDAASFEPLPGSTTARLVEIEPIPRADRRPHRFFSFEPYEQVGTRIGSFVLLGEVETAPLLVSNIFRSSRSQSDEAVDMNTAMRLVSNWSRHAVEFRANGGLTRFNRFDSEDENRYLLEARGRLEVSRRTNFEGLISRRSAQEDRSSVEVGAVDQRATIRTDQQALTFNHRFNRLSLQLRTLREETDVGSSRTGGVVNRNRDRSGDSVEYAARLAWEFRPTLRAFGEVATERVRFDAASDSDGRGRDARRQSYRGGLSFGTGGAFLRGEASFGYGVQNPDDPAFQSFDQFLVDANLAWQVTPLTAILITADSGWTETTVAGSQGATHRAAGLGLRHAFRRDLVGETVLGFGQTNYAGISLDEHDVTLRSGIEYSINRQFALFGRHTHTTFRSSDSSRNYRSDEVRIGARIRN